MHEELIARLEAATGPDRELDAAIFAAFYPEQVPTPIVESGYGWQFTGQSWWLQTGEDDRCPRKTITPPAYTASIDAALTLVPEGMRRRTVVYENGRAGVQLWWPTEPLPDVWGKAYASEAIATVIAALKAKDTTHD